MALPNLQDYNFDFPETSSALEYQPSQTTDEYFNNIYDSDQIDFSKPAKTALQSVDGDAQNQAQNAKHATNNLIEAHDALSKLMSPEEVPLFDASAFTTEKNARGDITSIRPLPKIDPATGAYQSQAPPPAWVRDKGTLGNPRLSGIEAYYAQQSPEVRAQRESQIKGALERNDQSKRALTGSIAAKTGDVYQGGRVAFQQDKNKRIVAPDNKDNPN